MLKQKLSKYNIILASKSPRRQFLLKELGLDFEIRTKDVDESFPKKLLRKTNLPAGRQVALYLCKKKAEAFKSELSEGSPSDKPNDLLITADTIVWINSKVLNKPADYSEAVKMLKLLSGKMHTVFTGVSLSTSEKQKTFCCETKVYFKILSSREIDFYVSNYKPFDKAGAYGAQECLPAEVNPCSKSEKVFLKKIGKSELFKQGDFTKAGIGQIGIVKKIIGSYFNVMGLPLKELYEELMKL